MLSVNPYFPRHKPTDPIPDDKRVCNVCLCSVCSSEFLLGLRCPTCKIPTTTYTPRKYQTLIDKKQD